MGEGEEKLSKKVSPPPPQTPPPSLQRFLRLSNPCSQCSLKRIVGRGHGIQRPLLSSRGMGSPGRTETVPHPVQSGRGTVSFWLCLSLWLIQDSNWKGRVLWKLFGGLATILQNWISCNEQKMREAHITRRGINFYLLIFIEKIINRKIEHSLPFSF